MIQIIKSWVRSITNPTLTQQIFRKIKRAKKIKENYEIHASKEDILIFIYDKEHKHYVNKMIEIFPQEDKAIISINIPGCEGNKRVKMDEALMGLI